MVLEPLVLESREELAEKIPQWKATLERLDCPESEKRHLIELLTYALVEKFSKLTREEIEKMLKLTPLDETVAGKELIQRCALNPMLFVMRRAGLPHIFKD